MAKKMSTLEKINAVLVMGTEGFLGYQLVGALVKEAESGAVTQKATDLSKAAAKYSRLDGLEKQGVIYLPKDCKTAEIVPMQQLKNDAYNAFVTVQQRPLKKGFDAMRDAPITFVGGLEALGLASIAASSFLGTRKLAQFLAEKEVLLAQKFVKAFGKSPELKAE